MTLMELFRNAERMETMSQMQQRVACREIDDKRGKAYEIRETPAEVDHHPARRPDVKILVQQLFDDNHPLSKIH